MKDREIKSCTKKTAERTRREAKYVIEHKASTHEVAAVEGIHQKTVWVDLTKRLPILAKESEEDAKLYKDVKNILDSNKENWASKGWEAANKLYGNPKTRKKNKG